MDKIKIFLPAVIHSRTDPECLSVILRGKKLEIRIIDEFIKLGQALKLAGVVEDGVEAKYAINDGLVLVNGEVENRRGRKIHPGDTISYDGKDIYVIG